MVKEPYRVVYHVVGVIYLEPGRELSGPDFARLWSTTSMYGKRRAAAGFWRTDGTAPVKQCRVDIGSLEYIEPLLKRSDAPIFGGGSWARQRLARGSTLDCDFYYVHTDASRCFGYETLPELMLSVSGQWFERAGTEAALKNYREHFEVADRYKPPYGLIDVSASEDCYAGLVYGSTFFLNSRFHRWVEHEKWLYACSKRRDQARGVYWGNYFGHGILKRLGGRERFLTRFRRHAEQSGRADALVWEFPNGVFVSLSLDPLGCKPGPPLDGSAWANGRWLVQELGSHGVLNPWGDDGQNRR